MSSTRLRTSSSTASYLVTGWQEIRHHPRSLQRFRCRYVQGVPLGSVQPGAAPASMCAAKPTWPHTGNHRGIIVSDPVGVAARLQSGRAFALSGDTAKAEAAYQDFLALWKGADPDVPTLNEAKAEYAKLQSLGGHPLRPTTMRYFFARQQGQPVIWDFSPARSGVPVNP